CQISLRAARLLHPATPFRMDQQHTEIGMAPHIQVHIDTAVVRVQIFSLVDSLRREARVVISTLKGPALSPRSQEVWLQFFWPWPPVATTQVKVSALSHEYLLSALRVLIPRLNLFMNLRSFSNCGGMDQSRPTAHYGQCTAAPCSLKDDVDLGCRRSAKTGQIPYKETRRAY